MRFTIQTLPVATLCALLLAGCAGASDAYPSLAIRDAERVSGKFTPVEPDSPPTPPVASDQDIGSIALRARETHTQFMSEEQSARSTVRAARGQSMESSARSRAEVSLASLISLRGQTALAMAELDALQAEAAATFAPTDGIAVAQTQVASFLSEQNEVIDSLLSELGQ